MNTVIKEKVLPNDLCIGCGACAFQEGPGASMSLDQRGQYLPVFASDKKLSTTPPSSLAEPADSVCPFSGQADDETALAKAHFGHLGLEHDARLGFYARIGAGYANEGDFRLNGSSGGLTNWLLYELFRTGEIDAVIGVGTLEKNADSLEYGYQVIESPDELYKLSKSKYYPVTLDKVLETVHARELRYAFVGIPCFVKTVRNLCKSNYLLNERIRFCIAIVCGHLKSRAFAEAIGWELGVAPDALESVDFRIKVPDAPANRYAVEVKGNHKILQKQVFDLFTSDWGLGFFKYKACDFCDDIAGETADITLGDAWLPEQVKDWQGHNILIVRNPFIANLLEQARLSQRITFTDVSSDDFVSSQAANYRHRHDGLAARLKDASVSGEWVPTKRISASYAGLSKQRLRVIRMRSQLRNHSHSAFIEAKKSNDFKVFKRQMRPHILHYHIVSKSLIKYLTKSMIIFIRRFIKIKV